MAALHQPSALQVAMAAMTVAGWNAGLALCKMRARRFQAEPHRLDEIMYGLSRVSGECAVTILQALVRDARRGPQSAFAGGMHCVHMKGALIYARALRLTQHRNRGS